MSWVFLAGDRVYKLKKPVRFPYLDFSTLARREAACRAELGLNRRLAPDVYLGVAPLVVTPRGLVDWRGCGRSSTGSSSCGGSMKARRSSMPSWRVASNRGSSTGSSPRSSHSIGGRSRLFLPPASICATGSKACRSTGASCSTHVSVCRRGLSGGSIGVQRRFLSPSAATCLRKRVRSRRIVDGHGDLRPEHIWLGDPVRIIDCLEFNARLAGGRSIRRDRILEPRMRAARRRVGRRIYQSAVSSARLARRLCPRSCFYSIAAIARRCGRAWRSPICWSPIRARRRNGRALPAPICRSRQRMPPGSSALLKTRKGR